MSKHHHNYQNHYNENRNRNEETEVTTVNTAVVDPVEEIDEVEENTVVEETTVVVEETPKTVVGVVSNCIKLNIRKEPKMGAEVVCEVAALSEVVIDPENSTDEWYSVCTEAGLEGFCMKQYVVEK